MVTFAAIGIKHVLRYQGRPILNPAAYRGGGGGVPLRPGPRVVAGVGPYGEWLLVALAIALIARAPTNWRLPVTFFAIYAPFSVAMKLIVGASLAPKLLALGVVDPATLFFGLYLVAGPRTAYGESPPSAAVRRLGRLRSGLPALGHARTRRPRRPPDRQSRGRSLPRRDGPPIEGGRAGRARPGSTGVAPPAAEARSSRGQWFRPPGPSPGSQAGILIVFVVGVMATATYAPTATPSVSTSRRLPGSGGGGGTAPGSGGTGSRTAVSCVKDNPSIGSSTLQALHKALGPSVILSYNPSSGTTVFYDTVNSVTITETDLYEDYGFAEFNGDDFAVSGCSP